MRSGAGWAFVALALLPARSALAFELITTATGTPVRWANPNIEYDAVFELSSEAGQVFAAAARSAFDRWSAASHGRIQPLWRGPIAAIAPEDGRSTIGIDQDWDPAFGEEDRTVAHTELSYDVTTGLIRQGDLHLNGKRFSFVTGEAGAFDAESVILHELGHVLGLAHSCGDPGGAFPSCFSVPDSPPGQRELILEAVMSPTLSVAKKRLLPNADDLAGLAVGYAWSPMVAVPAGLMLEQNCPGLPSITAEVVPEDPILELRRVDGTTRQVLVDRTMSWAFRFGEALSAPEPAADLVMRESQTGAYGALLRVIPLEPCPEQHVPRDVIIEECGCTNLRSSRRQAPGSLATLVLVTLFARRKRWLLAPVLGAALALHAPDAFAFKCSRVSLDSGPSLVWSTRNIPWVADEQAVNAYGDPAAGQEDLVASFQAWIDVDCSDLDLPFQGVRSGLAAEYRDDDPHNENAVVLVRSGWAYDRAAIAVTTTAYDRSSGVMVDADIEINAQEFAFIRVVEATCNGDDGKMDLRNTITHEAGHVIGLDHPPNTPKYADATMFASAPPCETKKRSLAQDDRDGMCTIYPTGAATVQCFPPNGPSFLQIDADDGFGCTATRSRGRAGGLWPGFGAAALLLLRRMRS